MIFFGAIALVEMIGGIVVFLSARTVFIEIEGLVLAGLGFLTFAVIGGCLDLKRELQRVRARMEKPEQYETPGEQRCPATSGADTTTAEEAIARLRHNLATGH
jgi:hypothetical protein